MKRLLLFVALATMMASCTFNTIQDTKTVSLTVSPRDWVPHTDGNGLNLYYYRTFNMPEITPDLYDNGSVQVYFVMYNDLNVPFAQQILPYVRHYENLQGDRWTRTVDFEYSQGSLTVYVTNSDFLNEIPPFMDFRVVMQW